MVGETFEAVLRRRLTRRSFLQGALAAAPLCMLRCSVFPAAPARHRLGFQPVRLSKDDTVMVPPGYAAQVLLRWGDPLFPGVPALDLHQQTAELQSRQFGFNCDYIGYFPLPHFRAPNPDRGLLVVNHEYTRGQNMFPGYVPGNPTVTQVNVELAAHGVTVVEVERRRGAWRYDRGSGLNRRITGETEIDITGPAAGHAWMKASSDPTGTRVRGTLNNCSGGKTPWGTVLTCEEHFHRYFANRRRLQAGDPRAVVHSRYGVPDGPSERRWELFHDRFDVAVEPNEPFRFGWVVEIDPYNPRVVPQKRTALGRFNREAATVVIAPDQRVVVYSGDDQPFEYLYKFVSAGRINAAHRDANVRLLNEGCLLYTSPSPRD